MLTHDHYIFDMLHPQLQKAHTFLVKSTSSWIYQLWGHFNGLSYFPQIKVSHVCLSLEKISPTLHSYLPPNHPLNCLRFQMS